MNTPSPKTPDLEAEPISTLEEIYGPDGPTLLELLQAQAEVDEQARESLENEVYRNPDLMAVAMDIPGREQRSPDKTDRP